MPTRKELVFDGINEPRPYPLTTLVGVWVTFREPQERQSQYHLQAWIDSVFLNLRVNNDSEKRKSVLFQIAEKRVEELVLGNQLDSLRIQPGSTEAPSYTFPAYDVSPFPFDLNKPLPELPFTRVFWQQRGKNERDRMKEIRSVFLGHLYDIHNRPAKDRPSSWMFDVGERIGIPKEAVQQVVEYLKNEDHLTFVPLGPPGYGTKIEITHNGIKYIEELDEETTTTKETPTAQPPSEAEGKTKGNNEMSILRQLELLHQAWVRDTAWGTRACLTLRKTGLAEITNHMDKVELDRFMSDPRAFNDHRPTVEALVSEAIDTLQSKAGPSQKGKPGNVPLNDVVPFAGNRQVFLAYQFTEEKLVEGLKVHLQKNGFTWTEGKRDDLGSISQDIIDKIRTSGFFLAVMTGKDILPNDKYTTSSWLIEEKGVAIAYGRRPCLIVEGCIDRHYVGFLQGDDQLIYFERDEFAKKMQDAVEFMKKTMKRMLK